jgi:hypothetical protein
MEYLNKSRDKKITKIKKRLHGIFSWKPPEFENLSSGL